MDIELLIGLTCEFRKALESVVEKGQYGRLTQFRHFPYECCRYSSDLLAEYLIAKGISMNRIKMVEGKTYEEEYTHCWLAIDDTIFVDITADQFNGKTYFKEYEPIPSCYVAPRESTYLCKCFDNSKIQYSRCVGINSYCGDIPSKLQVMYDAVMQQIKINS